MADLPISGLPVVTVVSSSFLIPIVSGSVTAQMSLAQVGTAISGSLTASVQSTGTTLYSTTPATNNINTSNGVFLGSNAGQFGTNASSSVFIGVGAGQFATNAYNSNFLGSSAGSSATNANYSNFLGQNAGNDGLFASFSNFFGFNAGLQATSASNSNFIGRDAGYAATTASNSNFIGLYAGRNAQSASYSNLFGTRAGYNGTNSTIGANNIIIGTGITVSSSYANGINLGGLIFGSGSYATANGNSFSGSAMGKVGINQPNPLYSFDVSGSGNFASAVIVSGSLTMAATTEIITLRNDLGAGTNTFNYLSSSVFYISGSTSDSTFNIINVPTTSATSTTFTFTIEQGATPYSASAYQINSSPITVKWVNSLLPTGNANKTDVIGLTAFRSGSTWNVLGSLSTFG